MSVKCCANECLNAITNKNPLSECANPYCGDLICKSCITGMNAGTLCYSHARHFIVCEICQDISPHPDVYTCSIHSNRICYACGVAKKCQEGCTGTLEIRKDPDNDSDSNIQSDEEDDSDMELEEKEEVEE